MTYKTLHKKQRITQHEPSKKPGVNSEAPEVLAVSVPLVLLVVVLLKQTWLVQKFILECYIIEIDTYTASFTGCRCPHKPSAYTCACCQNGGCPCGAKQPNQCTHCEEMVTCGLIPELFPPHH